LFVFTFGQGHGSPAITGFHSIILCRIVGFLAQIPRQGGARLNASASSGQVGFAGFSRSIFA
jgi:hypothetical protein